MAEAAGKHEWMYVPHGQPIVGQCGICRRYRPIVGSLEDNTIVVHSGVQAEPKQSIPLCKEDADGLTQNTIVNEDELAEMRTLTPSYVQANSWPEIHIVLYGSVATVCGQLLQEAPDARHAPAPDVEPIGTRPYCQACVEQYEKAGTND